MFRSFPHQASRTGPGRRRTAAPFSWQPEDEAGAEAAAAARDERAAGHTRGLASARANGEAYNTARALTDLAEILLAAEEPAAALPLTDEAIRMLSEENADQHVEYLRRLRERCSGPRE
ncbi:hypothetical protein ACFVZE_03070 [Streptomyces anulatus]|uniref:hypothetical protein n=1 Tax=Streptomyces TaxID=1883 RepID=UPI00211D2EB3|nr:hypothetical protein [Streptomyces sp. or3]WTC74965.1 hypothetical protein OG882_33370 [Streptomyces anulatus]WUD87648.1 hypothetical protein OG703_05655 [Streptomyces anulatus]